MRRIRRLIFVYDAASGLIPAIADSLKKVVGRGCPLCAITHGVAGKRRSWVECERSLALPITYLHTDELESLQPRAEPLELPCILAELEETGEQIVLLDAAAIRRARGTEADLKGRLTFRAASLDLRLPTPQPAA